ncbi:MAG TPA: arginase family protein [Solirubrobacteraceae bacterium]
MDRKVIALRCHISEPLRYARGVAPLAEALAETPRFIGSTSLHERSTDWAGDLAAAHGCLLEAGGQVEDAMNEGRFPVLVGGDCSMAIGTLPVVHRLRPDAKVLWLDAHGDFNTPDTSGSGWLGGMGLAGACGRFATNMPDPPFPEEQLVLCGVRSLDAGERELLEESPAHVIGPSLETLVYLQNALDGDPVYVHLDPDVLDPSAFPQESGEDGGLAPERLFDLLDAVADGCEVIGLEIGSYYAPDDPGEAAEMLADLVEPLLEKEEAHGVH